MRIALMVFKLILVAPFYILRIWWLGKHADKEKAYNWIRFCVKKANHAGRVKIEVNGLENLPAKDGYVLFPNHQGLFDVLVFFEATPEPFSFVVKKEVENVILLKQVIEALHSLPIDRKDLRQSMQVIREMTERVQNGENFLIFAEGTRSKKGNRMIDMKPGSFKSAVKAKAPIVPCALIDSYKPFDEKHTKPVSVKIFYLKPMLYDEYKDMTTVEIAEEVRRRIEEVLFEYPQYT
jgi:1-acyl-sn-glycerol-3-phosphate acyltransferase